MEKSKKLNILFLCTANSCRSQMAEGWAKSLLGEKFNFYSAGTIKSSVNPFAITVMSEAGIDLSSHTSKTTEEIDANIDVVFTVCSNAHENCPYFPGGKILHMGFDDPPHLAKGIENKNDVLDIYRRVRDEIKDFIINIESHIK